MPSEGLRWSKLLVNLGPCILSAFTVLMFLKFLSIETKTDIIPTTFLMLKVGNVPTGKAVKLYAKMIVLKSHFTMKIFSQLSDYICVTYIQP